MQLLFIHATDAVSTSCDEGANYNSPEDALAVGVRGAVEILADDIKRGAHYATIEIGIKRGDGSQILRSLERIWADWNRGLPKRP